MPTTENHEPIVTDREGIAKHLNVSVTTIKREMRKPAYDRIPFYRIGKRVAFDPLEVEDFYRKKAGLLPKHIKKQPVRL
jgi:hypothetical protein